jgi:hypothetical protein
MSVRVTVSATSGMVRAQVLGRLVDDVVERLTPDDVAAFAVDHVRHRRVLLWRSRGMRVQLCGVFRIDADGRKLEARLPGRQGRTLFAYLALNRGDVEHALESVHSAESAVALADWRRAWASSLAAFLVTDRRLLADCEAPWLDEWRRRLDDVLVRSLQCHAASCLGIGGAELAAAERAARRLVELSPYRESG